MSIPLLGVGHYDGKDKSGGSFSAIILIAKEPYV